MSVSEEAHRSDGVLVDKKTLMDVTELHTPNLEVLIGRASRKQSPIRGDIEGQDRKFVSIQVEQKLHCVNVADLECLVEE